jgi:hypothetical protein
MVRSNGYHALRGTYVLYNDGDAWGSAVEREFALAEFIYHNGGTVPESIGFHDAPGHESYADVLDDEGTVDHELADMFENREFTMRDAEQFLVTIGKYTRLLKAYGKDY